MTTRAKKRSDEREREKSERRFEAYAKSVEALRRSRLQSAPLSRRLLDLRLSDLFHRPARNR